MGRLAGWFVYLSVCLFVCLFARALVHVLSYPSPPSLSSSISLFACLPASLALHCCLAGLWVGCFVGSLICWFVGSLVCGLVGM